MGRTSNKAAEPAELIDVSNKAHAKLEALQDASAVHEKEKDEVFAAGVDIGRLEAMEFIRTVSTAASVSIFENVKKSKAWRLLKNPSNTDGQYFSSLDEFCRIKLGKSYDRLRELSVSINLLGVESFEQAERIGLRQRDYNAIKALPAPDQELVRRAVEDAQSKDEVVDLIQELATRTAQHKAEAEEAKAELKANLQVLSEKSARVDKLAHEAQLAKQRIASMPADEAWVDLQREASGISAHVTGLIKGSLRNALQQLQDVGEDGNRTDLVFMTGLVAQAEQALHELREMFFLPEAVQAGKPEWQQWAEKQEAEGAAS